MGYKILLFDVDNTLLDFDANEDESFRSMMEDMGETWTEEIYDAYKKVNSRIWKQIEGEEITVEEGVNRRFSDLMAGYGKTVDGRLWEKAYRRHLNQGIQEMPGVHQVLGRLRERGYELCVITNGMEETQTSRLSRSGLDRYFSQLFISGRIGAGKPSKEFFDYVKSHIPGFSAREALVIGDSLSSDVRGAVDAGIAACWITREREKDVREAMLMESGLSPDYTIHELTQLLRILD